MKRSILVFAGLSWLLLAGTGCGGDTFTATGGTGGTGGSTATTGGTGGAGGTAATTGGTGGTGGQGGDTTSAGGTGGQGGGPTCQPLSNDCTQCAFDACQDLYCACYATDDCPALVSCLEPCDPADMECVQACLSAHPDSIATAFLLGDCAAVPCSDVCTGVVEQQPCPECLFTMCPAEMNACLSDPDCYAIINCATGCAPNDFNCALMCTNGKPNDSINKAVAVQGCTTNATKCQSACSGG